MEHRRHPRAKLTIEGRRLLVHRVRRWVGRSPVRPRPKACRARPRTSGWHATRSAATPDFATVRRGRTAARSGCRAHASRRSWRAATTIWRGRIGSAGSWASPPRRCRGSWPAITGRGCVTSTARPARWCAMSVTGPASWSTSTSRSRGGSPTAAAGASTGVGRVWRGCVPSVRTRPVTGRPRLGYDYLHIAVDDRSRVAYVEAHADERKDTAAAFMRRASAGSPTAASPSSGS